MQPNATRRDSIPRTVAAPDELPARRRVLFVSADPDLRAVATRILGREGYRVQAVAHSGHALLLCRTGEFDLVVAELCGPDVSGPTLAAQLRRHCPGLSVLYLSNPGTPEHVASVIVRPFTQDGLIEAVKLALLGVAA